MLQHRPSVILASIAVAAIALGGCRTTTTSVVEYGYFKPPRFDASAYRTYAVVELVDGRRRSHPAWRIPDMAMVADDRAADLVLELSVGAGELVGIDHHPVHHVTEDGREHHDWGARGTLVIPYSCALYDGRVNSYLVESHASIEYAESVPAVHPSPAEAEARLIAACSHHGHHQEVLAIAEDRLRTIYRSEMLGEQAVIALHLASAAEFEPRIAEAYHELLLDPGPAGAERAAAIYRSIGFDGVDDDGEADKHARHAVAYGLATCAFIRRELDEVPKYVRIARSFRAGREGELDQLEAAAADLADRLAAQP